MKELVFRGPGSTAETDHLKSNGKKRYKRINREEQEQRHYNRKQQTADEVILPPTKIPPPTGRRYESDTLWWDK